MNNPFIDVAQVIVEIPARPIDKTFDYIIPTELQSEIKVGSRVVVPFAQRKVQAHVLELKRISTPDRKLKEIESVLDRTPPLTKELIALGKWMSDKYICLLITSFQAMLPRVLKSKTKKVMVKNKDGKIDTTYQVQDAITRKTIQVVTPQSVRQLQERLADIPQRAVKQQAIIHYFIQEPESIPLLDLMERCQTTRATIKELEKKGLIRITKEEVRRDPYQDRHFPKTEPLSLTKQQQWAFDQIKKAVDDQLHLPFLLHGVTGSGKTEIYLQSIAHVLHQGKEAIVLVPEISLTPQMVERFKGRFGHQVAVIHSRLSAGERYDEWRKIHEGKVKVAIGARSALFSPFQNLGLIVIDEEHESSYKQEENPRYHARDVAIFRGQYHQAPVILGSATPSLESYARAQKKVYQLLPLTERIEGRALPPVQIVDMRTELHEGNRSMFSRTLYQKIGERLERNEQMVIFLNRRGFSSFVMCRDCGYVVECPHCDISLTYHKNNQTLRCHYCGHTEPLAHHCPQCQSEHIRFFGTGTQKVEEELSKSFPGIRVIRMDVDTTRGKDSHERLLKTFGSQKADCLLGTQMIAKGLDFENVTLVGIMAADSLLHLPDFRSSERTFQLLTQVSGRAGRHQLPGEVVIQSYTPDHFSILSAAEHDYSSFYEQEMRHRRERGYPPYYYICSLTFSHEDLPFLVDRCERSVRWLKQHVSTGTVVLGPVASRIPRMKDRYRYQCMVKYRDEPQLSEILNQLLEGLQKEIHQNQLQVHIDMV